ncbi:peptidylprolyl isomerase [Nitrogeniibacter mangrovi]|uniref:Periplasmic chaperone PpiD n=1 Tax=Nitrogeniibacter mangrovi TaxID=2016596 RepID=A0A6C1B2E1_9RHOO|nr:SurA N-terminal domain-containing protein [Nitrogeniibacter mangrovi]QID17811.1 peptidylprolyl isomerase [Nitrogeniibacter mangrovi]
MFEAVRNNKRIAQLILGVISLTFAFWGVESYLKDRTGGDEVASVGGTKISVFDFRNALRNQQDRMRAASDTPVDPETFQNPLFKRAVLDNLINQRVLAIYAAEHSLSVTDEQLRDTIAGIQAFQENGQFSMQRYERAVRAQGLTVQGFQEKLRADLENQQVVTAVSEASVVPEGVISRFLEAQLEERTVHMVQLTADEFTQQVQVDADEARKYYDEHSADYAQPAKIKASYVVLTPDAVKSQVKVSEDEIRAEYEQRKGSLGTPEERKASHILIEVATDAPEADVKAAKAKAEALLGKIKANPDQFAALAKSESNDPGSAAKGGDLGYFGRGAMLAPFEKAVFDAKTPGLIPEIIRTEFGFHIIRLDDIRPSTTPSLEAMHDKIRDDLIAKAANRRFLEVAEQFANMVYEQPDSLQPAADAFGLKVEQTKGWIDAKATGLGGHESEALVRALFSDDVLKDKHNTDAIDVGDNTMMAARVVAHEPARQRSFDEVKSEVEDTLRKDKAAELAVKQGEAKLAKLQAGESLALKWGDEFKLKRGVATLPPHLMAAIFSAAASPLPAYTGVELAGAGYALFRIDAVKDAKVEKGDERLKTIGQQYAQLLGTQDLRAFLNALRERYEVKINASALASDEG